MQCFKHNPKGFSIINNPKIGKKLTWGVKFIAIFTFWGNTEKPKKIDTSPIYQ